MTVLVNDTNKSPLGIYVKALVFLNWALLLPPALSADVKPGTAAAILQP